MRARRWETLSAAAAVLLLFLTAYGNAVLLAAVSGALLVTLLAFRFFRHDGPRPGLLLAASVVGFAMAIALVWLLQHPSP
jgi:ABC-type cobalamin transport system permease subunit